MELTAPIESITAFERIPGLRHGFLLRTPGVDVDSPEKDAVLQRLAPSHDAARRELGMGNWPLVTSVQVHGANIHQVTAENLVESSQRPIPDADALATNLRGVALGIHVADCGAIWFLDPINQAIGLAHSGKKGTELGIAPQMIAFMGEAFGTRPENLQVALSPCIRPPAYEIDFAAQIREQVIGSAVPPAQYFDAGQCTSQDLSRHYSYRIEKGHTGRMLALLGWEPGEASS